jgi:hypothetical protein
VPGVVLAAAVDGGFMWNIGPAFSTAGALLTWSLCGRFGAVRLGRAFRSAVMWG